MIAIKDMKMSNACTSTQKVLGGIRVTKCPLYNICKHRDTIRTDYKPSDCPLVEIVTEDSISRQAMLEYQQYLQGKMPNEENHKLWKFIKDLPPVAPTQEPVLDKIRAEISEDGSIKVTYAITDDTKTDKGIEKLVSGVLEQAKEQVLNIIDKHKVEITNSTTLAQESCEFSEDESVLNKVEADIQELRGCSCYCSDGIIDDVEDIIDKYKTETTSSITKSDLAQERYQDLIDYFGDEEEAKTILEDRKEFNAWLERLKWHVKRADELARELEQLQDKN